MTKVRLLRAVRTRGGEVFPKGAIMNLHGKHRGRYTLADGKSTSQLPKGNWVRGVRRGTFEVIDEQDEEQR